MGMEMDGDRDGDGDRDILAAGTHLLLAVRLATRCQSSLAGRCCSLVPAQGPICPQLCPQPCPFPVPCPQGGAAGLGGPGMLVPDGDAALRGGTVAM